jgi:hypothetical protein
MPSVPPVHQVHEPGYVGICFLFLRRLPKQLGYDVRLPTRPDQ